jgi:twitching motility two-component system response regulator PilG
MHRTAVRCVQCGALVGLVSADEYAANKGTNEEKVQAAIRFLLERVSKQESQKARIQLGLAYLNLYRSAEALPQLKRAVELGPRNPALERLTANLADRRLILAVDDSLTVRKIVSITLERRGYSVLTAADGMQALSRLGERAPDLVLLDITMPRMDGYQVCKAIRQHPATKRIPVVMLSGKDGFFDKVKGKLVGATDYITKPFREERLLDAIEKYAPRKMRAS